MTETKVNFDQLGITGAIITYPTKTAPTGWLLCDGTAISRATYAALFAVLCPSKTFTVTIASPGVFTCAGHGLETGDSVHLTTTGALPTGLATNTTYYVIYNDADTFWLATSFANAHVPTKINTSGSQSGVHTLYFSPWGKGDGSTTFNVPNFKGRFLLGCSPAGDSRYDTLGDCSDAGELEHLLTTNELPSHTHGPLSPATAILVAETSGTSPFTGSTGTNRASAATTGATGGGQTHNNIPPYKVVNWIIKT